MGHRDAPGIGKTEGFPLLPVPVDFSSALPLGSRMPSGPPDSSHAMNASKPGEVIFEFAQIGGSMRVTAIDAATGTEATFQAPLTLSQTDMQTMALRKLAYVMGRGKK